MSKFLKTLREDPQWRCIGPYLYHASEHLLLVQDEKCHLLRFLQDLYGISDGIHASLGCEQAGGIDESAIGSQYQYTDAEMEELQYTDPVQYSPEGFQVPPSRQSTQRPIEKRIVENALVNDDTVRANRSEPAATATGITGNPTEDDQMLQDMGSDFS